MEVSMFRNREDAALQLADRLKDRHFTRPLVLAIPRGGVATGAVLARELDAELDVVLARKLRAPYEEELAIGALGEDGQVHLADYARQVFGVTDAYLAREQEIQASEIEGRRTSPPGRCIPRCGRATWRGPSRMGR